MDFLYQKSSVWVRRQCLVPKFVRTFVSFKKCGRGYSIFYLVGRTNCRWCRSGINSICLHQSCTHFFTRKCCDFLLPTSAWVWKGFPIPTNTSQPLWSCGLLFIHGRLKPERCPTFCAGFQRKFHSYLEYLCVKYLCANVSSSRKKGESETSCSIWHWYLTYCLALSTFIHK